MEAGIEFLMWMSIAFMIRYAVMHTDYFKEENIDSIIDDPKAIAVAILLMFLFTILSL